MNTKLAQYKLILNNDNVNSYQKVWVALMVILRKNSDESKHHTLETHNAGKTILGTYHFELAEHYASKLKSIGLNVSIEKGE